MAAGGANSTQQKVQKGNVDREEAKNVLFDQECRMDRWSQRSSRVCVGRAVDDGAVLIAALLQSLLTTSHAHVDTVR